MSVELSDVEAQYLASLLRMNHHGLLAKRDRLQRKFEDKAELDHVKFKLDLNEQLSRRIVKQIPRASQ